MNKKSLHEMTLKDKIEELLNDDPKTLFDILQLLPDLDDGCPDEEESELLTKLHDAKFVCVKKKDTNTWPAGSLFDDVQGG